MTKERAILEQLASIYFSVNSKLEVTDPSAVLLKYMPAMKSSQGVIGKRKIGSLFKVVRPNKIASFDDIKKSVGSMVLLECIDANFAVRGQFIRVADQEVFFVGAPWLSWINQNCPDINLLMSDFKAWDPQLDQLVLLSTERQNILDLENLAGELKVAKEQAEEASQVQADFFAIMSHELRTPLNGVVSSLSLIDSSDFSGRSRKMLDIAKSSSDNMRNVVDHVLNYSKLQAGGFENHVAPFNFRKLVNSSIQIIEPKAKQKDIEILVDVEDNVYQNMKADMAKIRQVLINILGNAVTYTTSGKIEVRASMHAFGNLLNLSIADTGCGIPLDIQPKIFHPFLTFDSSKGDEESGTGLGLNIASRMIEIMGGKIGFESEPGHGSRFFFSIPVAEADEGSVNEAPANGDIRHLYHGKVLLVEDNEVNRYLGQLMLEDRGIDVQLAVNGKEAVELAAKERFDLVFMDISMPVMDGVTATKLIRAQPQNAELPIVAMTAHAGDNYRQEFMDCGMNAVLHKPIDAALFDLNLISWLRVADEVPLEPKSEPLSEAFSLPPELAAQPVFLRDVADRLQQEIGDDGFRRFYALLMQDIERGEAEIEQALKDNDCGVIAMVAHRLKSASTTIGCIQLGCFLNDLEKAAQENLLEQSRVLIAALPSVTCLAVKDLYSYGNALEM